MTCVVVNIPHDELSKPELAVHIDLCDIGFRKRLVVEVDSDICTENGLGEFLDDATYFLAFNGQILDAKTGPLRMIKSFIESVECEVSDGCSRIETHIQYLEYAISLFGGTEGVSVSIGSGAKDMVEKALALREKPLDDSLLACKLMDFQVEAAKWARMRCEISGVALLALEQGMGKTLVSIGLIADLVTRIPHALILVVCPASVIQSWVCHFAQCLPAINVEVIDGSQKRRVERIRACESTVYISSYGCMRRDVSAYGELRFDLVVFDEVASMRNYSAKTSIAARKLRAVNRVGLSGTPIFNSITDLYTEFSCLGNNYFGSMRRFRKRFVVPVEEKGDDVQAWVFARMIEPLIRRQLKSDVLELPPLENIDIRVEMYPEQAEAYGRLETGVRDMLSRMDDDQFASARIEILALFTRLRQCAVSVKAFDADYAGGSIKVDKTVEMTQRLVGDGSKVCIFTLFKRGVVDEIVGRLEKIGIQSALLTGDTPVSEREEVIQVFNSPDGPPVILITNAGAEGLNIQAADVEIQMAVWFNRAVESQAAARIHRIGSKKRVRVYRLITVNTIEERMLGISDRKWEIAGSVLSQPSKPITRMSRLELLGLLG